MLFDSVDLLDLIEMDIMMYYLLEIGSGMLHYNSSKRKFYLL